MPPQSKEWGFIQSKELYHYKKTISNRHWRVFTILWADCCQPVA